MNQVWLRQIGGVLRLELKKAFLSKRGWWIYLLALGPVAPNPVRRRAIPREVRCSLSTGAAATSFSTIAARREFASTSRLPRAAK